MRLFLIIIVYCVITHIMKLPYDFAFGIILVVLGALKGYFSHEFNNFLNLASARELYKKNGLLDSFFELLSLFLIFINAILIDYEPFTLFEYVFLSVVFITLYRFLIWGVTRTIKERN